MFWYRLAETFVAAQAIEVKEWKESWIKSISSRAGMLYWNWNYMYHIGLRLSYPTSVYRTEFTTKSFLFYRTLLKIRRFYHSSDHTDKLIFSRVIETKKNGSWWSKFVLGVLFKAEIKGNYIKNRDPHSLKFHLLLFFGLHQMSNIFFPDQGFPYFLGMSSKKYHLVETWKFPVNIGIQGNGYLYWQFCVSTIKHKRLEVLTLF